MQISSDINSRRRRHNQYSLSCFTRSVSLFVFIYFTFLGLVSLFQGVFLVRLLAFVLFVALLFLLASVGYLALDCRQQEFRLWWWWLRQPALTLHLWNPMWWLRVKFMTRLRSTTQTKWTLIWMSWRNSSESTVFLKSSTTLLRSSVARKLGLSTLVQRLKIQSPLQKPPKGFLTPRPQ